MSLMFLCLKKYSVFLQPPRLAATPPIFYMRKTQREKRLPCSTNLKRLRQNFHFDTALTPYYIPRPILMVAI